MTKPFGLDEFEQRIQSLADRAASQTRERLSFGAVRFDIAAGDISVAGQSLGLTPDERSVLCILLHQGGRPLTGEEIAQRLATCAPSALAVDGCLKRLHDRLGAHAVGIARLRGLGFCLTRL
jgi:two-component system, OmpR family, response regulator QseB